LLTEAVSIVLSTRVKFKDFKVSWLVQI